MYERGVGEGLRIGEEGVDGVSEAVLGSVSEERLLEGADLLSVGVDRLDLGVREGGLLVVGLAGLVKYVAGHVFETFLDGVDDSVGVVRLL